MKIDYMQKIKLLVIAIGAMFLTIGCQLSDKQKLETYTIAYSSNESNGREVFFADDEGKKRIKVTSFTGNDGYPAVSPDGERMAFYGKYDNRKTWSIHTVNTDGTNMQRLTHSTNVWDSAPAWSPDGKKIVFAREYADSFDEWQEEVWLMNADGSEQRQIKSLEGRAPYFLQDGRIIFHSKTGPSQICIADIDGNNVIKLTDNNANDWSPKVSPDGTQVAFISNRDKNQEIYTMKIDGSNQKRITYSEDTDWGPAWSLDGEKLFFNARNSDGSNYVYKINVDGSSLERILKNGSQVASIKYLNSRNLRQLLEQGGNDL
jgi:TolB protein